MTASDSIENYKEVTASQKSTLESNDAKWVAPTDDLVNRAAVVGAVYNAGTGFFELNGLTDLKASDMEAVLRWDVFSFKDYGGGDISTYDHPTRYFRTNAVKCDGGDSLKFACTFDHLCYNQNRLEVFSVGLHSRTAIDSSFVTSPKNINAAFSNCTMLRRVLGPINLDLLESCSNPFSRCIALEEIHLHRLKTNLNLGNLPVLGLASVEELITFAINTAPVTVTLHPDCYERLTDELIAQASEKQITFTTP